MIRRLVLPALAALAALGPASAAEAAVNTVDTVLAPRVDPAAQRLAERYVPITMLREQLDPPCNTKEEQYQPTSVDAVLGNPTVTLTHEEPDGKLVDVKKAPTAADIAGLRDGYYLDYEGQVLGNTCVYARAFRKLVEEGKAPAITYAHIAREPNHDGFALQYWFYWYFNQFNDLHEGDWEGMQITFQSNTTAGALEEDPSEIIVFQHAGGERADWEDGKVQKEGTHPVVYPAAGSHATFYDSAVYLGNGQNGSGVGCDNTSEPLRELPLRPVLLPETAPEEGAFQWLSYRGRWGEREKGYNNGPTGPVTKTVWREPFAWMEKQRSTSPRLPGGSVVGGPVTGAFCGAVTAVTDLTHLATKSRPAAIGIVLVILLALVLLFGATRWGPIDLKQLRARRAFGQILRTARRLYRRHWWPLIPIGLIAFPIVGGVKLLAEALANGRSVDQVTDRAGVHLAFADLAETLGPPIAYTLVAAIVIVFVRELARGQQAGVRDSIKGMLKRFWRVVVAQLMVTFALLLLLLTVVGIPIAAWKYVSWLFVQQEVLFTDKSIREAFRGSSELVRGRWLHTVRVAGVLWLLSIAAGPLLGFALIFTSFPLIWINLLGSVVFALFIPYVAVGQTLLYFDLQVREEEEPVQRRRASGGRAPRRAAKLRPVKILAFSDLHRDLAQGARLVEMSAEADVVIGAGDFASMHDGLEETIGAVSGMKAPTVLVPGNNETVDALRSAVADWGTATVLHGEGTTIEGIEFYGLGAGIPVTPWDWSFDLDDAAATEMLSACPEGAVLILHSPPKDHCDSAGGGGNFGSPALLRAIEEKRPRLAVCGHIHESWGCESQIGPTPVRNLGPKGTWLEV